MGGEVRRFGIERERTMAKSFEQAPIVAALESRLEEICLPCRKLRLCGGEVSIIPAFSRRGYAGARRAFEKRRPIGSGVLPESPLRGRSDSDEEHEGRGQHEVWDCSLDFTR